MVVGNLRFTTGQRGDPAPVANEHTFIYAKRALLSAGSTTILGVAAWRWRARHLNFRVRNKSVQRPDGPVPNSHCRWKEFCLLAGHLGACLDALKGVVCRIIGEHMAVRNNVDNIIIAQSCLALRKLIKVRRL